MKISIRIKRFVIGAAILGVMALPLIACGDSSDFGEIGSRIDANQAQTAQLPHIHNGVAVQPTPNCRNSDGSYNC